MKRIKPCVLYRHFNAMGELLYVGISVNVFQRTAVHALNTWFRDVTQITIEHFSSVEEAKKAEELAIKIEKPKLNVIYNRLTKRAVSWSDAKEKFLSFGVNRNAFLHTKDLERITDVPASVWTKYKDKRKDPDLQAIAGIPAHAVLKFLERKAK
jgi:excinuclease UvrABC nuclease subunit